MLLVFYFIASLLEMLVFSSQMHLNLINYHTQPLPKTEFQQTYVIVATNDIHGGVFPSHMIRPDTKQKFLSGGLVYFGSMLQTIRNQYGQSNVLYLDAGDQYQGGIQASSLVSNGKIMHQFFNIMNLNAAAIGNHEFDYGYDFLKTYLKESKQPFLAANIEDSKGGNLNQILPNTKKSEIFLLNNNLKVGVIGITTIDTPITSLRFLKNQYSNLVFHNYSDIIINQSNNLKQKGADIIILLAHEGIICKNRSLQVKIWVNQTLQDYCIGPPEDKIRNLIKSLPVGTIDAFVQGHEHLIIHQYINNIPVVGTNNGGYYFNLIYLIVNKKTKKLERTLIQGPVPICEKIFQYKKRCDYIPQSQLRNAGSLLYWNFHHKKVVPHQKLSKMLNRWLPKMQKYMQDIVQNQLYLRASNDKQTELGNLISDLFLKVVPGADFSLINPHFFRSVWTPGIIQYKDFYNMFPFQNHIQSFEVTGRQLKKMFQILQGGRKGFYIASGLNMKVKNLPKALIQIKDKKNQQISDNKIYKGVSLDFLLDGGDDMKTYLNQNNSLKNRKKYGDMKTLIKPLLKQLKVLKSNNSLLDKNNPRLAII